MDQSQLSSIKSLAESLFQFEQESMLDNGSTMPVQYIIKGRGIVAIPSPFSNYEEKMRMSQFTTLLAGLLDADAIIFLSEAWFAVQSAPRDIPKGATPEEIRAEAERVARKRNVPPSEDPNREEKLMLMIFFGNGNTMLGHADIVRVGTQERAFTKDLEWMSDIPDDSQTTRLFKPWKDNHVQNLMSEIRGSLPPHLMDTLDTLRSSLEKGVPVEKVIEEMNQNFGIKEGHA